MILSFNISIKIDKIKLCVSRVFAKVKRPSRPFEAGRDARSTLGCGHNQRVAYNFIPAEKKEGKQHGSSLLCWEHDGIFFRYMD